jgi:hypothetical protein
MIAMTMRIVPQADLPNLCLVLTHMYLLSRLPIVIRVIGSSDGIDWMSDARHQVRAALKSQNSCAKLHPRDLNLSSKLLR